MATSLLLACGLNEPKLPHYIHLSEESDIDGSFLISSILGQRLRVNTSGTVLVCLQQNYQHYFNAGMRLGYNLSLFKGKSLSVIDTMADIAANCLESKWTADEGKIVENMLNDIRSEIESYLKTKDSVTILIDNLAILHNLGASNEELVKFCTQLREMSRSSDQHLSIITKVSNCEVLEYVDQNLEAFSDLHIRIIKLKSGTFKEVDGKLSVSRTSLNGTFEVNNTVKEILYKVNDRNIKIFNPGEIGVKI